jgi:hypothetical protein
LSEKPKLDLEQHINSGKHIKTSRKTNHLWVIPPQIRQELNLTLLDLNENFWMALPSPKSNVYKTVG